MLLCYPQPAARASFFLLGEAGILCLLAVPSVLQEADEVVRRKAIESLPVLAQLLDAGQVEITSDVDKSQIDQARLIVRYGPDARVLAEAICANPDWFVTHDKEHFLTKKGVFQLDFVVGTPGDLLQAFKGGFSQG